jgi:hypothetical protein
MSGNAHKTGAGFARGQSRQDYLTPLEFLAAVKLRFGLKDFAIDLAADASNAVCNLYYTQEQDSLRQSWKWNSSYCTWLNPSPCRCGIQPIPLDCTHASQNLSEMPERAAEDARVVQTESGKRGAVSLVVVSSMLRGAREKETGGETRRSNRESSCQGREAPTSNEPTRSSMETRTGGEGQRQAQTKIEQTGRGLVVDTAAMGTVQTPLAVPLRVLRQKNTTNPRPLCATDRSQLPRHSSMEYGSGVSVVQHEQELSRCCELVQRQAAYCPNCGATGSIESKAQWGFLNPPFFDIAPWAEKCATSPSPVLFLVPASVGSNWFRDFVHNAASQVLFLNGRLYFDPAHPTWGYPKDCMLCVYDNSGRETEYEPWDWWKQQ